MSQSPSLWFRVYTGFYRIIRWHHYLLAWCATALLLLFGVFLLLLRLWLVPHLNDYRDDLAAYLSRSHGPQVKIAHLEGEWQRFNLILRADNVQLLDAQGHAAVTLPKVQGYCSWISLLWGDLHFRELTLTQPSLHLLRDEHGQLRLAGEKLDQGGHDPTFLNWLIQQNHLQIVDGRLRWVDLQASAEPLLLESVDFEAWNTARVHRFRLFARQAQGLPQGLSLQADLKGRKVEDWQRNWSGQLQLDLPEVSLQAWRTWLPLPAFVRAGTVDLHLQAQFHQGRWQQATADWRLRQVHLVWAQAAQDLLFDQLQGRLSYQTNPKLGTHDLQLQNLQAQGGPWTAAQLPQGLRWHGVQNRQGQWGVSEVRLDRLDVALASRLGPHLPLPATIREQLNLAQPKGVLREVVFQWEGGLQAVKNERFQAWLEQLSWQAGPSWPGMQRLSGWLDAQARQGRFQLKSQDWVLDAPQALAFPLQLKQFSADVSWLQLPDGRWQVKAQQVKLHNADVRAELEAQYETELVGSGVLQLKGRLEQGVATRVWAYLPKVADPQARAWLKQALLAGVGTQAKLELHGRLDDFPFEKKPGLFQLDVDAKGVNLHFADHWPSIQNIQGQVKFLNNTLLIEANSAELLGTRLRDVHVQIPHLDHAEKLLAEGVAEGPSPAFLDFVRATPMWDSMQTMLGKMQVQGPAKLKLKLNVPLAQAENTQVQGTLSLQENQLRWGETLPPLRNVNANLQFTEHGFTVDNAEARALGGNLRLSLRSQKELLELHAQGEANVAQAARFWGLPLAERLQGASAYKLDLALNSKKLSDWRLNLALPLDKTRMDLPYPFNKTLDEPKPLTLEVKPFAGGRQHWTMSLGRTTQAQLITSEDESGRLNLERGTLGFETAVDLPTQPGLWLKGQLLALDLDAWWALWQANQPSRARGEEVESHPISFPLRGGQMVLHRLRLAGRDWSKIQLGFQSPRDQVWQVRLNGKDIQGDVRWTMGDNDRLEGRLKRLHVPASWAKQVAQAGAAENRADFPDLDLNIDDFQFQQLNLGRMELVARNQNRGWLIDRLAFLTKDGRLEAKGDWQSEPGKANRTTLDLAVHSENVGKFLGRFGLEDSIKRGKAELTGSVSWPGSPVDIDLKAVDGHLQLEAKDGQFAKVEPGIGKLLGILSLQSLPRRIALDFRDIFSEGLSFDRIEAKTTLRRGILQLDEAKIYSSAAAITLAGQVDVTQETQDLIVTVVPAVGEGLAVAAGVVTVNPLIGLAAYALQSLLRNPFGQLVAYKYHVVGHWKDPEVKPVDKLTVLKTLPPEPEKPAADAGKSGSSKAEAASPNNNSSARPRVESESTPEGSKP